MSREELRERRREARRRQILRRRAVALGVIAVVVIGVVTLVTRIAGGGGGEATAAAGTGSSTRATSTAITARVPDDPAATVSLAAVGDIVMGTSDYGLPPNGGRDLFTPVRSLLTGDVVIGNLEGTLTTRSGSKCGAGSSNCFAFRTPPSYAANLKNAGFTVMNLANNHAYDFGSAGQADTVAALRAAGLANTGRPRTSALVTTGDGVRVAVLGFAPYKWANRIENIATARTLVRTATARADLVVVVMHAGAEGSDKQHVRAGTEYFLGENRGDSVAFAHAVVAAGADLVVGSGPHVLRGIEFYRGRLIAYSLGNFTGWKAFALSGPLSVAGVLQVTLRADGRYVSGRLAPTYMVSPGAPQPGGSAVSTVASLSSQDFGARAARIAASGAITAPGGTTTTGGTTTSG